MVKGLPFKIADFIGLFNFEWPGQNEVGNIAILVLWTDCEKLYSGHKLIQKLAMLNLSVHYEHQLALKIRVHCGISIVLLMNVFVLWLSGYAFIGKIFIG